MSNQKRSVSHADKMSFEAGRSFFDDFTEARDNLERTHPGNERNPELAERLADITHTERSRRNAHYWRYRAMFRIANNDRLLNDADNLAEASLLDLKGRVTEMSDEDYTFARSMDGKGISAELGHIDQLGDWQLGKELDAQVRELPTSERLLSTGFIFGETYDAKDRAMISYKFYVPGMGKRASLKGVRMRAAADVLTEGGDIFEIVKQSTFLIDADSLSRDQVRLIERMMSVAHASVPRSKDRDEQQRLMTAFKERRSGLMDDVGREVIEPFIADPQRREETTAVLAATSLYFALQRHQ